MGHRSSLSEAGVQGGVVLGQDKPVVESLTAATGDEKYAVEEEIARGGMGAILRAVDRDIRRPVAMKVMLGEADERKRARFVEEAQVTGQLEHPNIVPIHELGVDSDGRLFFTMKLVKGRSLEQVLKAMKKGGEGGMSLGALLNAFVNVCNAVAFAHSKGVLHRDLKPANIMLGDYGEVLVMDWGLAKIIGTASNRDIGPPASQPIPAGQEPETGDSPDSKLQRIVSSFRQESGVEQTMDGTVVGTPVYMPPEQASGEISRLDQRSDIYSLGAILYELLMLKPPVEGKTIYVLLNKVVTGNITPPEQRTPDRQIAKELSAIAMKALATKPEDRYQTVEELRRDIELFIEGRAVSAKQDTALETVVKVVKRNKTASIVAAAAFVLLSLGGGVAAWVNYEARQRAESSEAVALSQKDRAETALAERDREQARREAEESRANADRRKSAPLFLEMGRRAVLRKDFDEALLQVQVAIGYDSELLDARMLKAQLLIVTKAYDAAVTELDGYLKLCGNDRLALRLKQLAEDAQTAETPEVNTSFAEVFTKQKAYVLAEVTTGASEDLMVLYRKRIEQVWPKTTFYRDDKGYLTLSLGNRKNVHDLSALAGIPIQRLDLDTPSIRDLGTVKGVSLRVLGLSNTDVVDLTPLRELQLSELDLHACRKVRDISPLTKMPLKALNLYATSVDDISPLAGMRVIHLDITGLQVKSFVPLKGVPLKSLGCAGTTLTDLASLRGMPLENLDVSRTAVSDLTPLEGMPLRSLGMEHTPATDLSPLTKTRLQSFWFTPKTITRGVDAIRSMKALKTIGLRHDMMWPAAEFWKRYDAGEFNK
ncbi:MAG: protein kinase [Planctomycetota bacterium]|nr:protein kinase [Planctomycetota bacterium]